MYLFRYVESKLNEKNLTQSNEIEFHDILPSECDRSIAVQAFLQTLSKIFMCLFIPSLYKGRKKSSGSSFEIEELISAS